jgi:hypothetical protein
MSAGVWLNCGSVLNLKSSTRCGCIPYFCQMRCTVAELSPDLLGWSPGAPVCGCLRWSHGRGHHRSLLRQADPSAPNTVRAAPQSREAIDTSGWWLNLVKKWFGLISQQAIRRGSFDSVAQLERAISRFVETWNQHAQPLVWTKTAQQIRRSIRNAKLISQT